MSIVLRGMGPGAAPSNKEIPNELVDSAFKTQSHSNAKINVCSTAPCWAALKNRLLNGDSVHAAAGTSL